MEGDLLKLSLRPREQLNIGEDVRIIYKKGDSSGIKIVLDVPEGMPVARVGTRPDKPVTEYYQDDWQDGERPRGREKKQKRIDSAHKT
jgi:hypothetical protein